MHAEAPLSEHDIQAWERRRDIELQPWQADLIIEMSKAYLSEMYAARQWNALPPYPPAVKMWKYVKDQKNGAAFKAGLKEKPEEAHSGNRKRR